MQLDPEAKKWLIKHLASERLSDMFGDGMEHEYVMNGCFIVGLNQMSDESLVEEFAAQLLVDQFNDMFKNHSDYLTEGHYHE